MTRTVSKYPPIRMLSSLAIVASVSGEPARCLAWVPTSRGSMFAPKGPPKFMSAMGRRDESSETTSARHAERRCSGMPI